MDGGGKLKVGRQNGVWGRGCASGGFKVSDLPGGEVWAKPQKLAILLCRKILFFY